MCGPDTSRNERTLCAYPNCTKTVWQDADGVFSSYCGASHRDAMADKLRQNDMCQLCQAKPKYVENGYTHPYCGKHCATKWQIGERTPSPSPSSRSTPCEPKTCKFAGCNLPVYVSQDGTPSQWCSQNHRKQSVITGKAETCLLCGRLPKTLVNGKQSDFCSRKCGEDAVDNAPIIFAIDSTHTAYQNVSSQFNTQWKHPTRVPTIIRIWKIYGEKAVDDRFSRYRLSVQRKSDNNNNNTRRRFHGTIRACTLGDNEYSTEFCSDSDCSLCRIIESSFELTRARSRFNFGRFGSGIYTSATSSKADSYAKQNGVYSPYGAMLLNEVVMGKEKLLTITDQTLTKAPEGFDSVRGEPGGDLNYDECIVYKNEAIRPLFLIIYKR